MALVRENKKLAAGEVELETHRDLAENAARLENVTISDARDLKKGFRYML
jgi:hypothetical protein